MVAQPEDYAAENKYLRRCINDLLSVLALPALWSGNEPTKIIQTLADILVSMLNLDFVYVTLNDSADKDRLELMRLTDPQGPISQAQQLSALIRTWLGHDLQQWPRTIAVSAAEGEIELVIVPLRLGLHGEIGLIVVGTQRANFPSQTEKLVLNVAANQAAISLQEAGIHRNQERVAIELDERVSQRTRELAAINEELRKEIAERKQVEERLGQEQNDLKRSEAHKSAILDSALDCFIAIDHEGRITEFNPAAERTFGYRRNDVVGRLLGDVIIPETLRQKHHAGFARYLATGQSKVLGQRLEMTALCSDGREIPVELTITRIPQDPPAFTGFIRDITERKQSEDALRAAHAQVIRSEERWRSVFENSAIGVALTDLNGRFIATNPVYQKMLGYSERELHQLTFVEITHQEDRDHSERLICELIEGKRQQFQIEKQYRRKDGRSVWVRNHVSIVPGSERVPRFLMALAEDITEGKHVEEALSKARSELAKVASVSSLGVLTASIAHEVNQPLSGIVTNASTCLRMLSSDPPNVEGARETARRTIRDGIRASDVIARLRTLYSKKDLAPEPMDLNEATWEVTSLLLSELQRNRVIVRQELAGDLEPITGDRIQLQQVILNLIRNASDAMSTVDDRPRDLLIKTQRDGVDKARLSIKDSGVGFELQTADRLFEAFYTTKDDGMGIGLSISRSIIEAHHGHLWGRANDGPGATFSFSIPCETLRSYNAENRGVPSDGATDAA